ncbi:hypothetical protein TKK_0008658 [Trichogramma kaykai]|uniref:ATP synthase-coupling factor 6, mitochondrial n=1 Tax=Trichogramma kaykai TaxID=54128 RepID=A0ABD2X4A6_9HYME
MLSKRLVAAVPQLAKRNFGVAAPALKQATDPIQQLFLDKIREFKNKGGKAELSPELAQMRKQELEKVAKQFGGGDGADMTAFPKFNFPEPKVEVNPINN